MVTPRIIVVLLVAVLAPVAIATAAPAGHKRPPKLKVVYQEDSGVVQPGKVDGFNYTCPRAAPHAISGYFGSDADTTAPTVTVSAMGAYGKGYRKWTIGVRNLTPDPQKYFVGAVCASGGPYKYVGDTGTVDPGQTNGSSERCPASAPKPISGFFYPQGDDTGQLSLVTSDHFGRAWSVVVKNNTDQPQPYVVGVVCAAKKQKVGYLGTDKLTVQPNSIDGAKGDCPRRTPHAVGGSLDIPTDATFGDIVMAGSFPTAKGRSWIAGAANLGTSPQDYFAGAVCMG